MPVADLYGVTASLRNLVRFNIWRLAAINTSVTDYPPEKADELGVSNLNLHLYHAVEDPSKRNEFAMDAQGAFPIKETPLPLILYYVLTAHSQDDDPPDIAGQQRLMGLAMKTFHDFPAFGDRLQLPSPPANVVQTVFDPAMQGAGNKIEIVPRQLTPEESINFWSAALNHTARLTAYYEVRSTLLPADEPEARAGLVLGYGLGVVPGGRPRLDRVSNVQTVTLPAALGGGTIDTTLSPAQAAFGARITATGSDLGDGSSERLVLAGPQGELEIDPVANPDWQIAFTGSTLAFTLRPAAKVSQGGAIAVVAIEPGIQSLGLRRFRPLALSGGPPRVATSQSNRLPFAIGAGIAATSLLAAPPRLRVDLAPGINAQTHADTIEIAIAGEVYARHLAGPVQPGEFTTPSPTRVEAALTFDPADGQTRAVRLGIAGVDSAPFWIEP
jgi:hypothetical protein